MAIDTLSRRALLEAKESGDYAPRLKTWPPDGYVAPTDEEFAGLLLVAKRRASGQTTPATWRNTADETVLRHAQLCALAGPMFTGQDANAVYGYARVLRSEMNRRGITFRSLAVLRCESCSHASERLFEATQDTHPGMENRHGKRITSAFFCARCWSGYTLGDLVDGPADEDDEAEDAA